MRIEGAYGRAIPRPQPAKNAPISQQLGDLFTVLLSVLVKPAAVIYSAALGMTDLSGT
jgi:hypothetical protein